MGDVKVTQADRDCARDVINALYLGIGGVAEIIARHRIAAMEEAAEVAERYVFNPERDERDNARNAICQIIAAAIRERIDQ